MNREELVLAILAASYPEPLTPVQLQKAVFLAQKNIKKGKWSNALSSEYNFQAYDYGPYCKTIYEDARAMSDAGLVEIENSGSEFSKFAVYSASGKGSAPNPKIPHEISSYISSLVSWVRKQTFSSLVSSVYKAYPEMKANSVFKG